MIPKPMRCPKCGCWVNFTYFDTAGQHWACPKCGNSSENQTIIYSTTTKKIQGGLTMAKYVIEIPSGIKWIQFYEQNKGGVHGKELKNIGDLTPYTEPDEQSVEKNAVNLCTSCKLFKEHFPECGDVNILFGDGDGNDNICCCNKYEPYNEPDRKTVEDAQEEAWEFAKQVSIMKPKDKEECWGTAKYNTINFGYSYQEAKERYEVWKKSKSEVHLYDEIVSSVTDVKATIINISSWGQWNCINVDGVFSIDTDQQIFWEKTGRSFPELGELLKKMKENENEIHS